MNRSTVFFGVVLILSAPQMSQAATWHVPVQCPTIQAGIDSASAGDTVLVACGTYTWTGEGTGGFYGLVRMKSGVCLRSETGRANCVTIDAENQGRVIYCELLESSSRIEGFTFTRGDTVDCGAGILCEQSSPRIAHCRFIGNSSDWLGGGMYCHESFPTVIDCVFADNFCLWYGGGIYCSSCSPSFIRCQISNNSSGQRAGGVYCGVSSPTLVRCTLVCNFAPVAGGIYALASDWSGEISSPILENTIIAFSSQGEAILCDEDSEANLTCCDVYGNAGGDWVGCIADQYGVSGNICEDPLFCDDCLYLQECSPCVEGYGCGRIGRYGVGCPCGGGPTAVEETSWSSLKALYR